MTFSTTENASQPRGTQDGTPQETPLAVAVSIVIVSYNVATILRDCLLSIARQTSLPHEIIVVDNVSSDDTCAMIEREFPHVHLLKNTVNAGFARANNQGLALARGEFVVFLNPDTIILDHALDRMTAALQDNVHRENTGLIAPHVFNADGVSDQASVFWFPTAPRLFFRHVPLAKHVLLPLVRLFNRSAVAYGDYVPAQSGVVEVVSGCCMFMPTALARSVGGMNDEYFMYSEEFDLCEAVQKRGLAVRYLREASIIHLGGASTSALSDAMAVELLRSMMRYFRRRNPHAIQTVRWLYVIGSAWRYAAWTLLDWRNATTTQLKSTQTKSAQSTTAQTKRRSHAAMLRWLWHEFDF
jgi:GT2 family glycosyltransferase